MCACERHTPGPSGTRGHCRRVGADLQWFPIQDTDLVPSDIAAGLALLHQQQDHAQSPPEPTEVVTHSPGPFQVSLHFCWVVPF